MIIAVIGGDPAPQQALALAEAVGREIATRGHMLICGGRSGVMEAACKGASEAGGATIGVLPDSDRSAMNPFVSIPIVTGLGRARNLVITLTAYAVIAVDGGYGTLSEIAFALQHGKPVAGLGTWRLETEAGEPAPIYRTEDPADAVAWAIEAVGNGGSGGEAHARGADGGVPPSYPS
jgi:uncharacterized protein (TIGR00725 family)